MQLSEKVKNIFDAMREGINIIDTDERIVFANDAYIKFLSREAGRYIGDICGVKLRSLRPGAMLPEVLKTGETIMQAPRREKGEFYFVNMYPIKDDDGVIVGGLSVVTFLNDANDFYARFKELEQKRQQSLRRVNKASIAVKSFDYIVAVSKRSVEAKNLARRFADTDASVLLTSENGAGKEVFAQAIHSASARRRNVFVTLNCADYSPQELESELFGYEEGAFPGAKAGGKMGLFEAASGGTLFLDEISEMDPAVQSKLLRALQKKRIRPVGATEDKPVDVRVIVASSADLNRCVEQGRMRAELYYQLNTCYIRILPLRERLEDLPALTKQILREISSSMHTKLSISDKAVAKLKHHDWPGNVRELRNVLQFSSYLAKDGVITEETLPEAIGEQRNAKEPLYARVHKFEREEIKRALSVHGNDLAGKKAAAAELGISLASLYSKLGNKTGKAEK